MADDRNDLPEASESVSPGKDWLQVSAVLPGSHRTIVANDRSAVLPQVELKVHQTGSTLPQQGVAPPTTLPLIPGYELLAEVGRGGAGVVFKARHLGLNRLVAVKMILAGELADASLRARFRTEAETVAKLHHPNIIQIHDVGEVVVGNSQPTPYMALEFLEGGTLAERIRGKPQPPKEAAALVEVLAQAMQEVHDQGIVHRDLKPSNVLMGTEGVRARSSDSGSTKTSLSSVRIPSSQQFVTPKITDFGLARHLEGNSGGTRSGDIVGTPSYMAPEQASGKIRTVGPAADIYALGAILYELLTGRPPFQGVTLVETVMQVLSTEPVPPHRLLPHVPVDLETICLKCLEKEPSRRYPTALALAEDLARWRAGETILARPAGQVEKAIKWVRRRPAVAALLGTLAIVLITAFSVVTWLWLDADQARQQATRAAAEKERARRQADRAAAEVQAVNQFLVKDLLASARPKGWGQGTSITVREVLDKAVLDLDRRFQEQPEVEASLRLTIGETYFLLGANHKAQQHFERAHFLLSQRHGSQHPRTLQALYMLAEVYRESGDVSPALTTYRQCLTGRQVALSAAHPDTLTTALSLASLLSECGKFQEAETLCRDALILCRQHLGDHPLTATALHVLAFCRDQQRDFTSSGPLWQEALPARQRLLGPEHPDTLMTLMRIFESYYFQDRFQEGIAQGRDCLERMQRVLGKDHPYTIRVQVNLGFLLARDGQHREAIELLRPSIGSYSLARTNPPEPASPLWKMEMLYIRSLEALGRWSEAERMLRARLELIRKSTVPFDDEPQSTLVELGWSLLHQGQHSQAEALLREGVALHRQRDGVTPRPASFQPYALPHALSKLGVCLTTLGRFKEAEQVLLESHTRLRFLPPYYPRELGNLARRLITLYEKWGKPAEAARWRQSHPGLDSFATMFPFLI